MTIFAQNESILKQFYNQDKYLSLYYIHINAYTVKIPYITIENNDESTKFFYLDHKKVTK